MKKLLMTAAALLLIGAGCGAKTGVEVTVPEGGGTIEVGGGASGDGSGSAGGGASGGYNY